MVPEVRTETRTVCVCVPTVEERTVMQTYVTCKPVTHMVRRCVDRGHWECREVPCEPPHRWKGCLKRLFHRDCCDSCCEPCCPPPTKTVRVWCPCPVWEEVPVTCMQRVCESRPVTCRVTVMRREMRQEQYQVTCCRCVPEQRTETYQVMVSHTVPYQATRTVAVCVPHQETVMVTRMVPRTVEVPAPAPTCCESSCGEATCCSGHGRAWHSCCHGGKHLLSGWFGGHKGSCCD
jgi:hypothetical protein